MTTYTATTPIRTSQLTTGRAFEEGRAPSHDGEYITVWSDGNEWICSTNADCFGRDDLQGDEGEALLERIEAAVANPDTVLEVGAEIDAGHSANAVMLAGDWIKGAQE